MGILIRRALVESTDREEPSPQVWKRIRAELGRSQPRKPVRWWGPVLQTALLLLFLVYSGVLFGPDWPMSRPTTNPSASPVASPALSDERSSTFSTTGDLTPLASTDAESPGLSSSATEDHIDAVDVTFLREYLASQPQTTPNAKSRREVPEDAAPTADTPQDLTTIEAKVSFIMSLRESTTQAQRGNQAGEQQLFHPSSVLQ